MQALIRVRVRPNPNANPNPNPDPNPNPNPKVGCAGEAERNYTDASLGSQFCCGLDQHDLLKCWGRPPQHPSFIPLHPLEDYIIPEVGLGLGLGLGF